MSSGMPAARNFSRIIGSYCFPRCRRSVNRVFPAPRKRFTYCATFSCVTYESTSMSHVGSPPTFDVESTSTTEEDAMPRTTESGTSKSALTRLIASPSAVLTESGTTSDSATRRALSAVLVLS